MLNQRINSLREKSLKAVESITAERALLVTEFYSSPEVKGLSAPVLRAKNLEYILANKELYFDAEELITGERGPGPKITPTYPEICLHSMEDLEILDSRPKVSFKVSEAVKQAYHDIIIPFWKGNSNREKIMNAMSDEWKLAYECGIFTEFQEQRAPGHTALGYKGFRTGFRQYILEIEQVISDIHHRNDKESHLKLEQLKGMKIAAMAIVKYAGRISEMLAKKANEIDDMNLREEIKELSRICKKVPYEAPETFHEALQHYWFLHLGVITEVNPWDSFNPGRLDQHLYPFFINDIKEGRLTKERVRELLQAFWIKFNNHPAPPKVGVTALESNTYTDFCLINLGGLTPEGRDAVNELSYLILDVIEEMRILQPGSMIQISRENPDEFLHRALKIVKTGFGQPSIFNTDAIIKELENQGKNIVDARNGGASGCVETGAFGTECYFLTGYFNLVKILELTLHNGWDPGLKKQVGLSTGYPDTFKSFEDLMKAFGKQLEYFINIKIQGNNIIEQIFLNNIPVPFLSLLIEDCITNGKDYNAGGARYNSSYIQGVGLGSVTDSLTAIKYAVFSENKISFSELLNALEKNYNEYEKLQYELIYNTPKYGNDDDYADEIATKVFEVFLHAVEGKPTPRGGIYRINMLPTTSHVYFGSVVGATPDGRKAGEPLSEGISPFQGVDMRGPTAVLRSASKIDHLKTGGTLLNQKFVPSFFKNEESVLKLGALIRTYFSMNGHHIQFNVVNAKTLRDAQKHPEKYKDLIVRVAGYSDYFKDLGKDLQNEIIRRTEHDIFK
jgi:formate C-acetyltransferase